MGPDATPRLHPTTPHRALPFRPLPFAVPESPPVPASAAVDVYIARQPIYDEANRRVAYELLYRGSAGATSSAADTAGPSIDDRALHAVVSIGLERLAADATAFVNLTREHLVDEVYRLLHPKRVVLELLESIDGDAEVVAACARAVAAGYVLALDDYDARPSLDPLLAHVRIVKIDVQQHTAEALAQHVARLRALGLIVLAERVETDADRSRCRSMGCTLFQGYVYSRPETIAGRSLSIHQATLLQLVSMLGDEAVTESMLDDAMRVHPSIPYALLRVVNSASVGGRGVSSIEQAIRLVGRSALTRWMLVLLAASTASGSDAAREAVLHALVRARLSELVAITVGAPDPGAHFLVGLMSELDVLIGIPMADAIGRLPLGADVREAVLHRTGPLGAVLVLVAAWQRADWDVLPPLLAAASVPAAVVAEHFVAATEWAGERLSMALS